MASLTMTCIIAPLLVAAAAAAAPLPQRQNLLQAEAYPFTSHGMRPCKGCGSSKLHTRDDLLAMGVQTLTKMKTDLTKETKQLQKEVDDQKEKNEDASEKLEKQVAALNVTYHKNINAAVKRTSDFAAEKAKAAQELDSSLDNTEKTHGDIYAKMDSLQKWRTYLEPFTDTMIKGWPKGCKCGAAKALLQSIATSLHLGSVDVDDAAPPKQALLRKSAETTEVNLTPLRKLVKEVKDLEETRSKLTQEKQAGITGFSSQQRDGLNRKDVLNIKIRLQSAAETTNKELDATVKATLKKQKQAAKVWEDSASGALSRLKKHEGSAASGLRQTFEELKVAAAKCPCLPPAGW